VIACAGEVLRSIIQSISPLLQQLETEAMISQLLKDAFEETNPQSEMAQEQAISVCRVLADKYNAEGRERLPESLRPIVENLNVLESLLAPSTSGDAHNFTNTTGLVVPFGMRRLRVVELIGSLLNVDNREINDAILEKGLFQHLIDAFFLYQFNNILQTAVMAMLNQVFRSDNRDYVCRVLNGTDLIKRVCAGLQGDLQLQKTEYGGTLSSFYLLSNECGLERKCPRCMGSIAF
jgi:hypothetical protein